MIELCANVRECVCVLACIYCRCICVCMCVCACACLHMPKLQLHSCPVGWLIASVLQSCRLPLIKLSPAIPPSPVSKLKHPLCVHILNLITTRCNNSAKSKQPTNRPSIHPSIQADQPTHLPVRPPTTPQCPHPYSFQRSFHLSQWLSSGAP